MSMRQRLTAGLVVALLGLFGASGTARAQAMIGANGLNGGFNGGFGGAGFNGGFGGGGFNNGMAVGGFNNNGMAGGFAFGTPVVGGFNNGINNFGGAVGFGAGPAFYGSSGFGYGPPVFNTAPLTYNNLGGIGTLFDSQVVQKRSSLPPVRRRRR